MLRIRLMRVGRRNDPHYRVVVVPRRSKPAGKYIEALGNFDPLQNTLALNEERIRYWMGQGAQATSTVHNMLVRKGIVKEAKRAKHRMGNDTKAVASSEPKRESTETPAEAA